MDSFPPLATRPRDTPLSGSHSIPDSFPEKDAIFPDPEEWVNPGDSVIVAPGGALVAGPLRQEYGVLRADIDLDRVVSARRAFDVAGHYARPDIFQLHVNAQPLEPVVFDTGDGPSGPTSTSTEQ